MQDTVPNVYDTTHHLFLTDFAKSTATQAIFPPRLQCNFQKLLRWRGAEKIASRLHGALAKFADRKVNRILRCFNISAIFQMLHCQHKTCYTQKFVRPTVMQ